MGGRGMGNADFMRITSLENNDGNRGESEGEGDRERGKNDDNRVLHGYTPPWKERKECGYMRPEGLGIRGR